MHHSFRKTGILLAVFLICVSSMLVLRAFAKDETHIVILGTSDMHGNVWSWSYEDNEETTNNGMPRLFTFIQQVRAENPITFLVDAGDVIQGTILTDDLANKNPDEPHPAIAAMNYMGFDAMTVGNHEFNWGVENMKKFLSTAEFPVLSQNILNKDGSYVTGCGWTIIEREGIRLAVIGVCTPDILIWDGDKEGVNDLVFEAPGMAVKKAIAEIGDQADIIMVSAHMGWYAEFDVDGGSDAASKIIEENPEVDLLQIAHMHITVNEEHDGVPVGGVRNLGREAARFDITLDADRKITQKTLTIVDIADYEPSEELRELPILKDMHEKAIAYVRGGGADEETEGYEPLGMTTAKFQPENEIKGLPEGKLQDTAVIDLILKVQLINSGADVTSTALFKDTGDLPKGSIYYNNIFDIQKYDNTLYRMTVSGKELKRYMEWAAECYNQWVPGDINISFDPEYPGYLYDMFAGVEYEINLSKPKGERIENVMFHGEPLSDDQTLILAVNNYRYASGIKAMHLAEGEREWESSNSIRDMLVAYFRENSPVEPTVDNNWRITGVDLSEDDPRRAELIGYINEGRLPVPYYRSYNLADYEALAAEASRNDGAGFETDYSH